jgi:hypothetical protein
MVQTKITLTLEPHDLKIINDGLLLLVTHLEDCSENPESHMPTTTDRRQLEMFQNDAKLKASEARAIINAIN